tara:strand:+ start:545 stop:730 length:186 start_codon:yes stop_codon:yes gene_type:complete
MKYNLAYDFAFEVIVSSDSLENAHPTATQIRMALIERAQRLADDELLEACGCLDAYEIEEW